jgi:(p)ppGpp synthase/HD superfamily hydrolase
VPEQPTDSPVLTQRYAQAIALAMEVHGRHVRKGGAIPYLTHVMSVSSLALENGGEENAAIAGLLHDTLEDGEDGVALRNRIQIGFGNRVLRIVDGCTEWVAVPGQNKPTWRARKEG